MLVCDQPPRGRRGTAAHHRDRHPHRARRGRQHRLASPHGVHGHRRRREHRRTRGGPGPRPPLSPPALAPMPPRADPTLAGSAARPAAAVRLFWAARQGVCYTVEERLTGLTPSKAMRPLPAAGETGGWFPPAVPGHHHVEGRKHLRARGRGRALPPRGGRVAADSKGTETPWAFAPPKPGAKFTALDT